MIPIDKYNVGALIRNLRQKKGWTQKELGEKCGINEAQIRRYELGKNNSNPKKETLQKIAAALNVPVSVFMDELSEAQRLMSTWEWIQDNNLKRKKLIIEILKTHNYQVVEEDIDSLVITDHQGFSFDVDTDDFQEMLERCDRDIRYNVEKVLNDSERKE